MTTPTVDPRSMPIGAKIVDQIGYANAALTKAAAERKQYAEQQTKVAELIPACVDALVEHHRIDASEKEAAAQLLRDPVRTLELLRNVAAHRNFSESTHLGTPEGNTKQASVNSLNSPHVGARSSGVRESDRRFFAGLGIPLSE